MTQFCAHASSGCSMPPCLSNSRGERPAFLLSTCELGALAGLHYLLTIEFGNIVLAILPSIARCPLVMNTASWCDPQSKCTHVLSALPLPRRTVVQNPMYNGYRQSAHKAVFTATLVAPQQKRHACALYNAVPECTKAVAQLCFA